MDHRTIAAIKRDAAAGLKVDRIAFDRDISPAVVRAILNGTYVGEIRSTEKDERKIVAMQLVRRGADAAVVLANFCDVCDERDINRWLAAGTIKPRIDRVMPLEKTAEAHRLQETSTVGGSGAVGGKLVLHP